MIEAIKMHNFCAKRAATAESRGGVHYPGDITRQLESILQFNNHIVMNFQIWISLLTANVHERKSKLQTYDILRFLDFWEHY